MEIDLLIAFVSFAFVASITPGPNNFMVMTSAVSFGWRRTLPHILGIAIGFCFMIGAVVLGVGEMLIKFPQLLMVVRVVGAAWMLWLAWQLVSAALSAVRQYRDGTQPQHGKDATRPFKVYEAALFQWANPKAWTMAVASAAAYSELAADPMSQAMVMVAVFLVVSPLSNGAWMVAGVSLKGLTGEGLSACIFNAVMAVIVVLTAVVILMG